MQVKTPGLRAITQGSKRSSQNFTGSFGDFHDLGSLRIRVLGLKMESFLGNRNSLLETLEGRPFWGRQETLNPKPYLFGGGTKP